MGRETGSSIDTGPGWSSAACRIVVWGKSLGSADMRSRQVSQLVGRAAHRLQEMGQTPPLVKAPLRLKIASRPERKSQCVAGLQQCEILRPVASKVALHTGAHAHTSMLKCTSWTFQPMKDDPLITF